MDLPEIKISLTEVLTHLKQSGADFVRMRVGEPPRFFRGGKEIPSEFPVIHPKRIRPLVCAVLTEEQIGEYLDRGYIRLSFRLKELGELTIEAYFQKGMQEALYRFSGTENQESIFGAHQDLAEEARQNPSDADVYWNLGVRYQQLGEDHQALRAYEKADEKCPQDAQILTQIAHLKSAFLNRNREAIETFQKALACDKPPVNCYYWYAQTLLPERRFNEAMEAVQTGLKSFPDEPLLLEALGVLLMETGKPLDAAACFQKILDLRGPNPGIEELKAKALSREQLP